MSIRDVVTGGFGNGTFTSTIPFTVTDGYSIGEAVATIDGPGCWAQGDVFLPGFKAGDTHNPSFVQGDSFLPGFKAGQKDCN